MLHYIIQVVCFQLIFLVIYDLFLRKETFFNTNRVYLLGTAILSLVLPFIKVPEVKQVLAQDFTIILPEVIIGRPRSTEQIIPIAGNVSNTVSTSTESWSLWMIILFVGMALATFIFMIKLGKLSWMISKNPKRWRGSVMIIELLNSTQAFSFFNRVFIGQQLNEAERTSILNHELVHVKQLHSLDLMCFELLRIVFWFNPLIYMYQSRIAILHEYIADSKAIKYQNKLDYYNDLLSQVFDTNAMSFVNPFFEKSLIKKRIVMLSRTRSKQIHLIKYALIIPFILCMLVYTSSYAQKEMPSSTVKSDAQPDDDLLKQRLYDELVQMQEEGRSFKEITDYALIGKEKYICSKEEYYRFQMFTMFMSDQIKDIKSRQGTLTDEDSETNEALKLNMSKTYDEYLAWKQTDEAKKIWEMNDVGGVLKLFVNDLANMTDDEKRRQDAKLKQLFTDDYYHKLVVSDFYNRNEFKADNSKTDNIKQGDIQNAVERSKIEVPFGIIDQVPMLPECEAVEDISARKKCVAEEIAKHVNAKFNTKLAQELGLIGRQRISVMFKIDKLGNVRQVRARASHPELEDEAIRVISLLPKFIPGQHKGEPVIVPYSLPILFQVNSKPENEISNPSEKPSGEALSEKVHELPTFQNVEVPYHAVDEVPYLLECESTKNQDERKKCVSQAVAKFVNLNFDMDMASSLDLVGVQRISAIFKIDTSGKIVDIKARAPHADLEKEAIRVISELPTFIPGKDDGKVVTVLYALPIKFEVVGKKRKRKTKN